MSSRRLVPTPLARKQRANAPPSQRALPPHAIFPKRRAVPPLSSPPSNYDVMALIAVRITALLWEYRHVIFLIAACWFLLRGWLWLCQHRPLVAWFLLGFLRRLFGSGDGGDGDSQRSSITSRHHRRAERPTPPPTACFHSHESPRHRVAAGHGLPDRAGEQAGRNNVDGLRKGISIAISTACRAGQARSGHPHSASRNWKTTAERGLAAATRRGKFAASPFCCQRANACSS